MAKAEMPNNPGPPTETRLILRERGDSGDRSNLSQFPRAVD